MNRITDYLRAGFFVLIVCGLIKCGCDETVAREVFEEQHKQAVISEKEYCKKAGFVTPTWSGGGRGSIPIFYCSKKDGQLVPFLPPKCNSSDFSGCPKY